MKLDILMDGRCWLGFGFMRCIVLGRTAVSALSLLIAFSSCKKSQPHESSPVSSASHVAAAKPTSSAVPPPEDVAGPPPTATKTSSGLTYRILKPGTGGDKPQGSSVVKVIWAGWTTDGNNFGSSFSYADHAATLPVSRLQPGWIEALQFMTRGEKTRLWIPPNLAYGDPPRREGAPKGTVVIDLELVDIVSQPPPAPADVAKAPVDAKRTASGVVYRVLQAGSNTDRRPQSLDTVSIRYTGWTPDGRSFDSSVARGDVYESLLSEFLPGWRDALQLMTEGAKWRLWIPKELAFDAASTRPDQPPGPLVYDIELVGIKSN